jgi:Uma2 family endonuclease
MTTTAQQLLTADDLLRLYSEGVHGELIRGVLHETMPPEERHGVITADLTIVLGAFIKQKRLGRVTTGDAGVWIERDPDTVRGPDIAFFSKERMGAGPLRAGYSVAIPDLVVELVSPNDKAYEAYDKARMWLSHGVRLVWIVNPETRTVDIHRTQQAVEVIDESTELDGADVLPGFTCPLSDIFPPVEDPQD